MSLKHILFVGGYPNEIDRYRNVFFQNLIFALADKGIDCTVISPISCTKYMRKVSKISRNTVHTTRNGNKVRVYYPRYISASAKNLLLFNTEIITQSMFQNCALKEAERLGENFDCVYGHFFLGGGLAAIKIAKHFSVPSFVAYGECDYESQIRATYGDLKPKDVDGLTGIISVSTKNTAELNATGLFANIPVIMCPNAVDLSSFKKKNRNKCRKKFNLPEDKFIVGFVGYFIERKGPLRVLEACERIDGVYTAFAGKGPSEPKGKTVLFAKSLPHEEICDFLNAVDIFVLPTLNEGCCNAVLEAMASGTPVVSSNLPFNRDILNNNNSIMIDPMNIDEIEKAIRELKNDRNKLDRFSENGIKTVSDLSINRRAEKIYEFMEECISND